MLALVVAEGIAIVLLGVLVAGLLRSHGEVLRTLHRLGAGIDPGQTGRVAVTIDPPPPPPLRSAGGEPAFDLVGVTPDDETVGVGVTGSAHDTLLAFLSSGCESCQAFWHAFGGPLQVPGGARLVVVTGDPVTESETLLRRLAPSQLPVVMSSQAWADYQVPGAPHFVYVDGPSGTVVGEGTAPTWPQVVSLLDRAVGDRHAATRHGNAPVPVPHRDNPDRVDAELTAAGITPGHPSLYAPPEAGAAPVERP